MDEYKKEITKDSSDIENYQREAINIIARYFGLRNHLDPVVKFSAIKEDDVKNKMSLLCEIVNAIQAKESK